MTTRERTNGKGEGNPVGVEMGLRTDLQSDLETKGGSGDWNAAALRGEADKRAAAYWSGL